MRALLELESQSEQAYEPEYHHKLRGCIWELLRDTKYEGFHGESDEFPFAFSNPFPVRNMEEGDIQKVIISSPYDGIIDTVENSLKERTEFNIGELEFDVSDVSTFPTDVGDIGTLGTLQSASGIYVPIYNDEWDMYDLSVDYNAEKIGWTNEYPFQIFLDKIVYDVDRKQTQLFGEYLDIPSIGDLFEEVSLEKEYSVTIPVSSAGYEYTFVVSKWEFEYLVQSDDHRRWLNILLDTGIGWRNTLGFGFINKQTN